LSEILCINIHAYILRVGEIRKF